MELASQALVRGGSTEVFEELRDAFDATSLYMKFTLSKAVNTSKGIFMEIPHRGWIGWVCSRNAITDAPQCQSRFLPSNVFSPTYPVDVIELNP